MVIVVSAVIDCRGESLVCLFVCLFICLFVCPIMFVRSLHSNNAKADQGEHTSQSFSKNSENTK